MSLGLPRNLQPARHSWILLTDFVGLVPLCRFLLRGGWLLQFASRSQTCWNFQRRSSAAENAMCAFTPSVPWSRSRLICWFNFDATLGFPGEGPEPPLMSLVSANIGSIATNPLWKTWDADIVCLQETRVGKNNHRSASKNFQTKGWTPCLGALLPCLWHKSGSSQTPCGGTLVAAPDSLIRFFHPSQDQTRLFDKLFRSRRVAVAWCQVTAHRFAPCHFGVCSHGGFTRLQDP